VNETSSKPAAIILVPVLSAIVSTILAPLYAALIMYCPFIYVNALLVVAYATLTGLAAGAAVRIGRVRMPLAAAFLALLGAWIGFYFSWCVWLSILAYFNTPEFPGFGPAMEFFKEPGIWLSAAAKPGEVIEFAREINSTGIWSFGSNSDRTISGMILLAVWAVEFLLFSFFALKSAYTSARALLAEGGE
jgi:hypothetical protein